MTDTDAGEDTYRAKIASRNRKRDAKSRERKLTTFVFGLLAYSAFSNLVGALMTLSASPLDAALSLVLGVLYALGVYRVWFKDDVAWWPVAIPAGISIALLLLSALAGVYRPIPLLLNIGLLVLVPLRSRALAAASGA